LLSHADILRSWGNPASLPDHFARHGRDFGARNADEYALLAYQFLHRASVEPYQAKIDNHQVLRIYDPRTGSFGAYNPDGTTKTFFKPNRAGYFDRQPGRPIDLRNPR
jgi:pyocin large subunit-like protein